MEVVKDLLEKGVDPNFRDQQGMSLLHVVRAFCVLERAFNMPTDMMLAARAFFTLIAFPDSLINDSKSTGF